MDTRLLKFAEVLFRGDATAIAAARAALDEPADFIARHANDLGYIRPKSGWAPEPWPLLLDVAQIQGWLWEVDWKADPHEVAEAVRGLAPADALEVEWSGLATAHTEAETLAFLSTLATLLASQGESLVCLDRGSDSYPLALLPAGSLAEAMRMASEVGGRVDLLAV